MDICNALSKYSYGCAALFGSMPIAHWHSGNVGGRDLILAFGSGAMLMGGVTFGILRKQPDDDEDGFPHDSHNHPQP
jgi:hypothetical protein